MTEYIAVSGHWSDIQDAVDLCDPGDTVVIPAGNHNFINIDEEWGELSAKVYIPTTVKLRGAAFVSVNFSGDEQITLASGTAYFLVFINPSSGTIDADNYISEGYDSSSNNHGGNSTRYTNGAWVATTPDNPFEVYGDLIGGGLKPSNSVTPILVLLMRDDLI